MWSASAGAVAPRRLKQIIGKWNEQFAGLDQQDSQELLAFLLNGLNEDLNRVSTKPYADQPDRYARLPSSCCPCGQPRSVCPVLTRDRHSALQRRAA